MTNEPPGHEWSEEALFSKAQLYAEQMERHTSQDWQFGLWSALLLELLGRASLAHISPTLLAGSQNWRNLAHALGRQTIGDPFQPSSISAREVFKRLHALDPSFSREMRDFCSQHTGRRNSELHFWDTCVRGIRHVRMARTVLLDMQGNASNYGQGSCIFGSRSSGSRGDYHVS